MPEKTAKDSKKIEGFGGLGAVKDKFPEGKAANPASSSPEGAQGVANGGGVSKLSRDKYDALLSKVTEGTHNPNPFDFVFFANNGPAVYERKDLDGAEDPISGYLEVELKALTPVHIAGTQVPVADQAGTQIAKSWFYRQGDVPCIPGSSIRGMLRSFIEALTNGWVSQAQEEYEKGGAPTRHFEFKPFGSFEAHQHACMSGRSYTVGQAIPALFKPLSSVDKIDIATYLFGYVENEQGVSGGKAISGKVMIEDADIAQNDLQSGRSKMLDTKGMSMMGGPEPRANWWHMRPKEVLKRSVRLRRNGSLTGRTIEVAQFMGEGFWGRKFYYHQIPERCIQWYQTNGNWPLLIYSYDIECLAAGKTASFKIYLDRVPEKLLTLLYVCLFLPGNMRHKLGYGKAFGYGSVELSLRTAMLRKEKDADWPSPLKDCKTAVQEVITAGWVEGNGSLINLPALKDLKMILHYNNPVDDIIFTYPPFDRNNFAKVVQYHEYNNGEVRVGAITPVDENAAIATAETLWGKKLPLHFMLYQARAKDFKSKIMTRRS